MTSGPGEILAAFRRRRRFVVRGFLGALLAAVLATTALDLAVLDPAELTTAALAPNLAFAGLLVVALRLVGRDRLDVGLGLVVAVVLVAATLRIAAAGVEAAAILLFLPFVPVVLAGLLLNRPALHLSAGTGLAVVLVTLALQRAGLHPVPLADPDGATRFVLQFAVVLGIVQFFLDRFGLSLNAALSAAAEREAALSRETADRRQAEDAARVANARIEHLNEDLKRSNVELRLAYDATIEGWARTLDLRDEITEGHSRRVTALTVELSRRMGMRGEALEHVRRGALLHDIGKMAVPDAVLQKPDDFDESEWDTMREHPRRAYELLAPVPFLRPALDIPYAHHERWDGSGYPRGLKGREIPLPARIFAVVDVYDALTNDRPYRGAWTEAHALAHIRAGSGSQFDPAVVDAFLDMIRSRHAPVRPRSGDARRRYLS